MHPGTALTALIAAFAVTGATPSGEMPALKTEIGVQISSADTVRRARIRDNIRTGDRLRIWIRPADDAWLYVVHSDGSTVTRLQAAQSGAHAAGGSLHAFPSQQSQYEIDGRSGQEQLTIICSRSPIDRLEAFLADSVREIGAWEEIARGLERQTRRYLHEPAEKPYSLAGNVRSFERRVEAVPALRTYSGDGMVMATFDLRVQE